MTKNEAKIIITGDSARAVNAVKNLESEITTFAGKAKQRLLAVTAAIATIGFATSKIKDYIVDVTHMAGRYEMLGISMMTAGKNAGYSIEQMAGFEAKLRETGIAAIEARQTLTRMAASQMDLAESARLARAAQDLAVVGGINSSEAFERLIYAIQSAQVEMLRTIGLNVNFEEGYKKLAKQLGINTTELSEYEKMQSRINTVLQGAAQYQGIYEKAMTSAEKQNLSLKRVIDDYKVAFGEAFQPAYLRMIQAKTEAYKNLTKTVSDPEFQENLKAIAEIFADIYVVASKLPAAISQVTSNLSILVGSFSQKGRDVAEMEMLEKQYEYFKQKLEKGPSLIELILFGGKDVIEQTWKAEMARLCQVFSVKSHQGFILNG
ncbi:MAG: hypothetical protein QMD97_04610, partial [Candidatus Aenigmarchaeota archaeon]|nr:hypothetical protein [Candidatus Aenigmarchaeota archaeon]